MLSRVRIEVDGEDSAAACEEALTKYEHALQVMEAQRYPASGCEGYDAVARSWSTPGIERDFFNEQLGREVTDEVIEYDPSAPGYKGRRVVQFRRIDTRSDRFREPTSENTSQGEVSVHLNGSAIDAASAVRRAAAGAAQR